MRSCQRMLDRENSTPPAASDGNGVGEIQPGAEAASGAGQHHHAALVAFADLRQRGVQVLDQFVVQRVELFGAIERDEAMSGRG